MGDAPRWFQLYWSTSNELVESLVSRAERCGCSAIVLTLDTTMLGWRIRDLDLAYLPFLRGKGIAQYTSDPVFVEALQETLRQEPPPGGRITLAAIGTLLEPGRRVPRLAARERALRVSRAPRCAASSRRTRARRSRGTTSRSSASGRGCRSCSRGSCIRPTRSRRSSTGWTGSSSRTTAGARSTARSRRWTRCPAIVEAVAGRVPVVLDSGVRSGADVFRALALGASAVGLGRPYVWGLAAGGEEGVREVIRNLRADFDLTMGLAGVASVRDIGRDNVDARVSRVEAVVFDLDGVLVDSEHIWDEVREELARERGGRWHERAQADMMGMSSPEWSRYMHDVDRARRAAGGDQRRGRAAHARRGTRRSCRSSTAPSRPCGGSRASFRLGARVVVEPAR